MDFPGKIISFFTVVAKRKRFSFWVQLFSLITLFWIMAYLANFCGLRTLSSDESVIQHLLFLVFLYLSSGLISWSFLLLFISLEQQGNFPIIRKQPQKSLSSVVIYFVILTGFWIYWASFKRLIPHHRDSLTVILVFWTMYFIDVVLWKKLNKGGDDYSELDLNKTLIFMKKYGKIYFVILSLIMLFWVIAYAFYWEVGTLHFFFGSADSVLWGISNIFLYSSGGFDVLFSLVILGFYINVVLYNRDRSLNDETINNPQKVFMSSAKENNFSTLNEDFRSQVANFINSNPGFNIPPLPLRDFEYKSWFASIFDNLSIKQEGKTIALTTANIQAYHKLVDAFLSLEEQDLRRLNLIETIKRAQHQLTLIDENNELEKKKLQKKSLEIDLEMVEIKAKIERITNPPAPKTTSKKDDGDIPLSQIRRIKNLKNLRDEEIDKVKDEETIDMIRRLFDKEIGKIMDED